MPVTLNVNVVHSFVLPALADFLGAQLTDLVTGLESKMAQIDDIAQNLLDHAEAAKVRDDALLAAFADLKAHLGEVAPDTQAKFDRVDSLLSQVGVDPTAATAVS